MGLESFTPAAPAESNEPQQDSNETHIALNSLRSRIENSYEQRIAEYFSNSPEFIEHYSSLKRNLFIRAEEFLHSTKGTSIEKSASLLVADLHRNIDRNFLILFTSLNIVNRKKAMNQIKNSQKIPPIKANENIVISNAHGMLLRPTDNFEGTIFLASDYPDHRDIDKLLHTFWHELIHYIFQDNNIQKHPTLFEGITEYLTRMIIPEGKSNFYTKEFALIVQVLQLNQKNTFDFYLGEIDRFEYEQLILEIVEEKIPSGIYKDPNYITAWIAKMTAHLDYYDWKNEKKIDDLRRSKKITLEESKAREEQFKEKVLDVLINFYQAMNENN